MIYMYSYIYNLTAMSYFRESPSHYSRRSPPRIERELIEEEMNLKNALRNESDIRRLTDQISLLQIKLRKTEELEMRVEGLIKQNGLLTQQNQQLSRELAERRYQLERVKVTAAQVQEREIIKTGQMGEVNRTLEMEIELLKKEKFEGSKLYEAHIQKLQLMLEDKIKALDILEIKFNDLLNQKEVSGIRFEEERNKLKNLMARTSHDMEKQLEYTKERTNSQKYMEIQTLKKNYASQVLLLEDEIAKLKELNHYKTGEFEAQLAENRALRNRSQSQLRAIESENQALREKILKLEELNRSQVVNIQVKYKDLQRKDANDLISGHVQEVKTLIAQIQKLNWLLREKNNQINNLIRDKRDQKALQDQRELAFRAEIDTLKNKLQVQTQKNAAQNQEQTRRIAGLTDRLQKDSESYHERVNNLNRNISELQSQNRSRQNQIDRSKAEHNLKSKELQRIIDQTNNKLTQTKRQLSQSQKDRASDKKAADQLKSKQQREIADLSVKVRQLQTQRQELSQKIERNAQNSGDSEKSLRLQLQALRKNIALLQKTLGEQQSRHASEMEDLSSQSLNKINRLTAQYKTSLEQIKKSRDNQIQALRIRLEKANRDREYANKKCEQFGKRYDSLEKHFSNPAQGSISERRGESCLFQSLLRTQQSVINIF